MDFMNEAMRNDLMEMWRIQDSLRESQTTAGRDSTETYLRQLLHKTEAFVARYNPETCSVTVGFPPGAGVSFTWRNEKKPTPRYLAEV
jgi:hypothetical protein